MKIKTKTTLVASLLMVIPTLIAVAAIGWIALDNGRQSLVRQVEKQLISVRETTENTLELLLDTIDAQALTFSRDRMVVDATKLMSTAFQIYASQKGLLGNAGAEKRQKMRKAVEAYYRGPFSKRYSELNPGEKPPLDQWLADLNDTQVALQYSYIVDNPNPLNRKDELTATKDNTLYDSLHQRFHPSFREFREAFDYYDIFLVNTQGDVLYSVSKRIDFAANLLKGNLKDSSIGRVFQAALKAEQEDAVIFSDYAPYPAAYGEMASFVASPVYEKGKKIGVLLFQLPVNEISAVMTHGFQWQEVGLGKSGETYLVGQDRTLRSEIRSLIEEPEAFFERLKATQISPSVIEQIRARNSSIGLLPMDSPAIEAALSGEKGIAQYPDSSGQTVIAAYAPLRLHGIEWAIIARMKQSEALVPVEQLKTRIGGIGLAIAIAVLLLGGFIGILISRNFVRPIEQTVDAIKDIAEGDGDLTQRLQINSRDEMGELAHWFNRFMEKLQTLISDLAQVTSQLGLSSQELSSVSGETRQAIVSQKQQTEDAAAAIHQMASSVQEMAHSAAATTESAMEARNKAGESRQTVQKNMQNINDLMSTMDSTSEVISRLEQDSTDIGGVLDVIRNIAEQTNLLALNAAIEAARAGEQGRGFAVVADEVRTLASRTQESTEEIQHMIERLQNASKQAVDAMARTRSQADQGQQYANRTGEMLTEISDAITQVSEMNTQIAHSLEEQRSAAMHVSSNVEGISEISEKTASGAEKTASASEKLAELSEQLKRLVGQFRV